MKGLALTCRGVRTERGPGPARLLIAAVILVVWVTVPMLANAQRATTALVIKNPATTLRILDRSQAVVQQASAEIWIESSDVPAPEATTPTEPIKSVSPELPKRIQAKQQAKPRQDDHRRSPPTPPAGRMAQLLERTVKQKPQPRPKPQWKDEGIDTGPVRLSPGHVPVEIAIRPVERGPARIPAEIEEARKPAATSARIAEATRTPRLLEGSSIGGDSDGALQEVPLERADQSVLEPSVLEIPAEPAPVSDTDARLALLQPEAAPAPAAAAPQPPESARPPASRGEMGPFEVIEDSGDLSIVLRRSKLLRTKVDIYRTAVVDPAVCDVVQFTPREISIIGRAQGATHVTFWFEDGTHEPITYLVRVVPDPEVQERREAQYGVLEEILAELFPESKVELVPVADKLIVRGQARDAAEAAQILAVIRGEAVGSGGMVGGRVTGTLAQEETQQGLPASQVINMLRIPGIHQIALRVKIAELNRAAARNFGVDVNLNFNDGKFIIQSLLNAATGNAASLLGTYDNGDLSWGIHYLEKHGVMRMLSEPTLVTMSGRPATFIAGGEFAVPTTVGVAGAAAVTTDFRAYGAVITFLPVVLDKDRIRLEVAPEFSQIDQSVAVNGTPGLTTRAVTTTVEMREGQTLAIAGLLDDSMKGNNEGNLPIVAQIFGRREITRNETELIILVTPELIHPVEPEAVPPLPGFDVTEPTNAEFFIKGRIEGRPTHEYRSTIWPRLRRRYQAGGPAMISGPFGHGD